MGEAFQSLLDSGGLYLILGAVICVVIGIGAARRLFQVRGGWSKSLRQV
jgi:hypothetical protein